MEPGQKAIVGGNGHTAICTLQVFTTPAMLPVIEGAPDPKEVAAALDSMYVDQVAYFSFVREDLGRVIFAALHVRDKGWFDLQQNQLMIVPIAEDVRPLQLAPPASPT